MMRSAGLVLVSMLLMSAPAGAAEPRSRIFRDWLAGCDNTGRCVAQSMPAEGAGFSVMLRLERDGGAAALPVMSLILKDDLPKGAAPITITLDGQPFPTDGMALATVVEPEVVKVKFSAAQAKALVEAARHANGLQAVMAGQRYEASLSGAADAMRWLDEQQGLPGAPAALIQEGASPRTPVPPATPLPRVTAIATAGQPALPSARAKALTDALRARVANTEPDCEDTESLRAMDSVVALGRDEALVMLACNSGAYSLITSFWIIPGMDAAEARKLAFQKPGNPTDNLLVNAEYDPEKGRIDFNDKGRGPGDCGSIGSYAWTGKSFVLTHYEDMPVCRGLLPGDFWMVLWRSEVKVAK